MNRPTCQPPRFNRLSIQPDTFAFLIVTTERRVLPTNLVQLHRLHSGMTFDGKQSIRSLNRPILARVS